VRKPNPTQPDKVMESAGLPPGDALEASVYRYLEAEIKADRFWLRKDTCKIFRKRRFHSRERQADITFDAAIEVYAPGTRDVCLLVLIECKDSGRKVPVDEIEEFHSKVRQVAGSKGILVSTAGFQRGTITFAASNKIALGRYFAPNQLKWELRRALIPEESADCLFATRDEVLSGLTGESTANVCGRLYGCHGRTITNVPSVLMKRICEDGIRDASLLKELGTAGSQPPTVSFLAPEEIRERARSTLAGIQYRGGKVDLEALCAERSRSSGLVVRQGVKASDAENAAGVLGRVRFDPLEIVVYDIGELEVGKRRFTLGHELGHVILDHGRYIESEYCDSSDIESGGPTLGGSDLARLEWQANRFASELLMPADDVAFAFQTLSERLDVRERGFGPLYVDSQPCNRRAFLSVAGDLSGRFGVSVSAAAVRLKTLGLLNVGDLDGMSEGLRAILGKMPHDPRSQSWSPAAATGDRPPYIPRTR
jgi:Zn-dependent peptidase ImmA (M78 family)